MIEMIKNIPIEDFLVPYGAMSIILMAVCWLWANAERTLEYTIPAVNRYKPVAVAALRGGWKSVIQLVLYFLWRYDRASITKKESYHEIVLYPSEMHKNFSPPSEPEEGFGKIGEAVANYLQSPRKTLDLMRDERLRITIKELLKPVYKEMESGHIMRNRRDRARIWTAVLLHLLVINVIGGIKLYYEILLNHSLVALVLSMLFSIVLCFVFLNPAARFTRLGARYLRLLEKHYENKLDWFRKARNPEDGTNPPMAIAIYGIDPFWIPSDYYRAFRDEAHGSTGKWKEWISKHQGIQNRPREVKGRRETVFF